MKFRMTAVAVPALVAACSASPPHLDVGKRWSDTIRNYDLIPIYPPQEDVQPGDVFMLGTDSANPKAREWVVRISSADVPPDASANTTVKTMLADNYRRRLKFAPLPQSSDKPTGQTQPPAAAGANTAPQQGSGAAQVAATCATATGGKNKRPNNCSTYDIATINDDTAPIRMRRALLPELKVASFSSAELSGGASGSSLPFFGGGISGSNSNAVDIELKDIEELHISEADVLRMIHARRERFLAQNLPASLIVDLVAARTRKNNLVKALCETDFEKLDIERLSVLVANQVVYAHSIKYSYNNDSTVVGSLAAQLKALPLPATGTTNTGSPTGGGGSGTGGTTGGTTTGTTGGSGGDSGTGTTGGNGGGGTTAPTPAPAPASSPDALVTARLAALNQNVKQFTPTSPGVSLSFGFGRSGNLALERTDERPIAIGIAGSLEYTIAEVMAAYTRVGTDSMRKKQAAETKSTCEFYGVNGEKLANYLAGPQADLTTAQISTAIKPISVSKGLAPRRRLADGDRE